MTIEEIKAKVGSEEYDFLRTNEHLGANTILLAVTGSHGHGIANENSDIDLRGIALNSRKEILLGSDFGHVVSETTDTTIYSLRKVLSLLSKCNPYIIEMLGCLPEHYLVLSDIGKQLINNRKRFLSKICIHTFGNYSTTLLRRLQGQTKELTQKEMEAFILKSIVNAEYNFKNRYLPYDSDNIKLYIDSSDQTNLDEEVFVDINLNHYPLRDYAGIISEMRSIVSSYDRLGKRNKQAIEHEKLGKHMASLVQVYLVGLDILEKEDIITYRADERELLLKIRAGEYLDADYKPTSDFYDILNEYEKRFEYAKENTSLPDLPDYEWIKQFEMSVNEKIVMDVI